MCPPIMQFHLSALRLLATSSIFFGASLSTFAQPAPPAVKASIEQHTQGSVKVDRITATPVAGVYQVMSGGEIFYTDSTGRFAFVGGSMMDLKSRQEVHGNGRRKMAVFEDPLCPICRVFTKFVDQLEDVTVYRFVFPVIDPKSAQIARAAWCSANRKEAWTAVMNGRRVEGPESCDVSGIMEIIKFGEKFNIANTPTVVLGNGKRLVGATPPEQFIAELDALDYKN